MCGESFIEPLASAFSRFVKKRSKAKKCSKIIYMWVVILRKTFVLEVAKKEIKNTFMVSKPTLELFFTSSIKMWHICRFTTNNIHQYGLNCCSNLLEIKCTASFYSSIFHLHHTAQLSFNHFLT